MPSPNSEEVVPDAPASPAAGLRTPAASAAEDIAAQDRRLMAAAADGDHAAFAKLYDRLAGPIFSLVLRMVGDHAEAEDVFQEIFVRLWKSAPNYDGAQSSVFSWVVTIARGKAIDHLRSRGRRRQTFTESVDEFPEAAAASASAIEVTDAALLAQHHEEAGLVRRVLTELPGEQRESIELAFFGGLSHHEISARLQQPLGTVKARIRRGLLRLRDYLPGRGLGIRQAERESGKEAGSRP
ncbi:MAG: sigma-70 family RNA polymerase sigma factor [Verrucomicrobia bacterium]|nr:sigma-70 family RNA polymerase sigma factor [Verrucomicrobiota bacterium]